MRAEKRKRYLVIVLSALLLLTVPAVYLRVLAAAKYINGERASAITGSYGTYCDRYGTAFCADNEETPTLLSNLIGFDGVIANALESEYSSCLGPRGFKALAGLESLEGKQGAALCTTLLPLSSQEEIAEVYTVGGYNGAVFAYNYVTGEVYTALSLPGQNYYTEDAPAGAYFNKAINGTYTPGSTMKIVALVCALQQKGLDVEDFIYDCEGYWELPDGNTIWCTGAHGYGLTIADAIGLSCNCFIAQLASRFEREETAEIMTHLGFDFNHQEAGERYVDSLWRSNGSMTFRSTMAFQDLWGFVGQGDTLAAPIDMAMIAGAIANEGTVAEPYLVERITDMDDDDVRYESGEAREVKLFSAKVAQQAGRQHHLVHRRPRLWSDHR